MKTEVMKLLIALLAGTTFGTGLAVSGMTDTQKVLGFLDIAGNWDASLLFVMGSALFVTIPAFYLINKLSQPIFAAEFCLPKNSSIDKKLVLGSTLFGIGWGLVGLCPGPAISSLVYLETSTLLFFVAMLGGMFLQKVTEKSFKSDAHAPFRPPVK